MTPLVISLLSGLAGHVLLEVPTREWFPEEDNNRLVSYVEGVLILILCAATFFYAVLPRRQATIALACLCAAACGVGAGTALGYVLDGWLAKLRGQL